MHSDDGIAQAMGLAYAEEQGRIAQRQAGELHVRVAKLEKALVLIMKAGAPHARIDDVDDLIRMLETPAPPPRVVYGVAQFQEGVMLPDGCRAGQWMVTGAMPGDFGQDRIIAFPFETEAAAREAAHRLIARP